MKQGKLPYVFLCAGMATLLSIQIASPGFSHPDAPGPPPIKVNVALDLVEFKFHGGPKLTNITHVLADGGPFGDAEVGLAFGLVHVGHGNVFVSREELSLHEPYGQISSVYWYPDGKKNPKPFYVHDECTPVSPMTVAGTVVEIDSSADWNITQNAIQLGTSAIGAAAGTYVGGKLGAIAGSWAGPIGTAVGAAIGFGFGYALNTNGNDDWGKFSTQLTPRANPGHEKFSDVEAKGEDGDSRITFSLETEASTLEGCSGTQPSPSPSPSVSVSPSTPTPSPTPSPSPSPTSPPQVGSVFPPLHEAFAAAGQIKPEKGNPADLTHAQVLGTRRMYREYALGLADWAAVIAIHGALDYAGAEEALALLGEARSLRIEGLDELALERYEDSFDRAVAAQMAAERTEFQNELPFGISLAPSFLSIKREVPISVLVVVPTDSSALELAVTNKPSKMDVSLRKFEEVPFYELRLDPRGVAPGRYFVDLIATDGLHEPATATLAIRLSKGTEPRRK